MSRLSKTEIYAIQWLDHQNFSSLEIATELKIHEKQVVKTLEKVAGVNKPGKIKTVVEPNFQTTGVDVSVMTTWE